MTVNLSQINLKNYTHVKCLNLLFIEQMSKVANQLNRRNLVKSNKSSIQQNQQKQIKNIQQNLIKKMQEHDKKRQKIYSKKLNHFKLIDQNWKIKLEEIQKKKKNQYKQSLEKAIKYRKEAETFWTENNQKKHATDSSRLELLHIPVVQSEGYFSIKTQVQRNSTKNKNKQKISQSAHDYNRKTQSKNQIPTIAKTLLPQIENRKYQLSSLVKKNISSRFQPNSNQSISLNKLIDDKMIQQHIQKSKNLMQQKEQFALQKALEKLKKIQQTRRKCKRKIENNIKQAKLRRQLRQSPSQRKKRRQQQQLQKSQPSQRKHRPTQRQNLPTSTIGQNQNEYSLQNNKIYLSRSRSIRSGGVSLEQSIIQHKQAKQKLQTQKFQQRGALMKQHVMKQKKGQMMRVVKQTINKLKQQALKESI